MADPFADVLERKVLRQVEKYPAGGDFDSRGAFKQTQPDCIELRVCQLSSGKQFAAQDMHQHVGGGMQEQPELVGGCLVAAGAVRFQSEFVVFDVEFGVAATAVNGVVEVGCPCLLERGDDIPGIGGTEFIDDHPANDPARTVPGGGPVISGGNDPAWPVAAAFELEFGLLFRERELAVERGVLTLPDDERNAVSFAPGVDFRLAVMAVGAEDQQRFRETFVDFADNPLEHGDNLAGQRGLAGPDDRGDEFAGEPVVNVKRHQAVFVLVTVEKQELLRSVTVYRGRVHVDDDRFGRAVERVEKNVAQRVTEPDKFLAVHPVFQTGHGRLGRQRGIGAGDFSNRGLKRRIEPEMIAVVRVFVALANLENALTDEIGERMLDI